MQNILSGLVAKLAAVLEAVGPFAKAVVPAAAGIVNVLVNLVLTGSLDSQDLATSIAAEVLAVVVYLVPNKPKPKPVPTPAPGGNTKLP